MAESSRIAPPESDAGSGRVADSSPDKDSQIEAGATVRPFVPARLLRSGNRQTIFGSLFPARPSITGTTIRQILMEDDDSLILHDDCPPGWRPGGHTAILMHGLSGCHQSGYMVRCASKLLQRGVRTFRLDHRGCGAGETLARYPYHAGRTDDVAAIVNSVEKICPDSPISLVGFSLSGNLLLRYLGQHPESLPLCLFRAVAVCPPVDLQQCTDYMSQTSAGQRYDWYFTRRLIAQVVNSPMWRDTLPLAGVQHAPRRLFEFDELFTAPASGFDSAHHYYSEASSRDHLHRIRVHTTILASSDDPVVDPRPLQSVRLPENVQLLLSRHGGHLGFIGRSGVDPDRRWMDWRVVEWLLD